MEVPKFEFVDFWNLPGIEHGWSYWLVSSEGDEFIVPREAVELSKTLCGVFNLPCQNLEDGEIIENVPGFALRRSRFAEAETHRVQFNHIPGKLLYLVVQYMYYRLSHPNDEGEGFGDHIPRRVLEELTLVANFLGI